MERGRGRRRRGESLFLLPFHHFCPISFTHFIPPLHVSPLCPALSSSLVLHPLPHPTPSPSPSHSTPHSVPSSTVAPLLAVAFPPLTVAVAILHRRLNGRPPALGGCITEWLRMASVPSRSVFLCFFFPLPSSLTRGRLRCAVSKHRQLK